MAYQRAERASDLVYLNMAISHSYPARSIMVILPSSTYLHILVLYIPPIFCIPVVNHKTGLHVQIKQGSVQTMKISPKKEAQAVAYVQKVHVNMYIYPLLANILDLMMPYILFSPFRNSNRCCMLACRHRWYHIQNKTKTPFMERHWYTHIVSK
ncbi:hypothetical protein V8C35DRAFT_29602 [Trichoderma chlorosporum]